MPVDLDALAVQVGRETLADLEEWPIATPPRDRIMVGVRDDSLLGRTAILGARAMLAKLREMGLVVEWKPIEEAPKDGTEVDIWVTGPGSRRVANCRWVRPSGANWGDRFGDDHELSPQWTSRNGTALDRRNGSATHFAKLPKGPGHD